MRFEGVVRSWNDERGFGFIAPSQGGQELFFHIKAYPPHAGRPQLGEAVTFGIELTPPGKKRAVEVRLARAERAHLRKAAPSPASWGTASYFAVPAFIAVYFVATLWWHVPLWVLAVYAGASAVCFAFYAADKSAAVARRRRVSEATLHALRLLGGWPGAIVAQQVLRHKSSKASFRSAFWATVVVNVMGFLALSSPWIGLLRGAG